jgi:hypothetical protein
LIFRIIISAAYGPQDKVSAKKAAALASPAVSTNTWPSRSNLNSFISYNAKMIEQSLAKLDARLDEVKSARAPQGDPQAEFPQDVLFRHRSDLRHNTTPWHATTERQLQTLAHLRILQRIDHIASRILALPLEDVLLNDDLPILHQDSNCRSDKATINFEICRLACDPANPLQLKPESVAAIKNLVDVLGHNK